MQIVLNYLEQNYKTGEPIFISDIHIDGVSDDNLKQSLKRLVDAEKVKRFEKGIYYLPRESRLRSGYRLSADIVAKYKYISRHGRVMGYYSGHTFANQLGLSNQVPVKVEIVSNESAPVVRDVVLGKQTFTVRKARIPVNEENYKILQLLELLKDIEQYDDGSAEETEERIKKYIMNSKITRKDVDRYIEAFPIKIYKSIYDMRLDYVFA